MKLPLTGHISPTWNIAELGNLDMELITFRGSTTPMQEYIDAGHTSNNLSLYVYFDPSPMPAGVESIKKHFAHLHNVKIAINCLVPGQYMPWHVDAYGRYIKTTGLADSTNIFRILIMAQDSQNGQYVHIGDKVHSSWCAGDWFGWYDDTPHATYNLSNTNRFIFQLTTTVS